MKLVFAAEARDNYLYWQQHDRKLDERINRMVHRASREPFAGTGKPEPLRHALAGCWSRRITDEHRMVCRVEGDTLLIVQLRYHY